MQTYQTDDQACYGTTPMCAMRKDNNESEVLLKYLQDD